LTEEIFVPKVLYETVGIDTGEKIARPTQPMVAFEMRNYE